MNIVPLPPTFHDIQLNPDSELKLHIEKEEESTLLEVISGTAEIFGCQLINDKTYKFPKGTHTAVYTWTGCKIRLQAQKNCSVVLDESPMLSYLDLHCSLELRRIYAAKEEARGPIVMIAGPCDVGKSSLCKTLLNYSIKMTGHKRRMLLVDIDVGQGDIAYPGTIGAIVMDKPTTAYGEFQYNTPLVYHYGDNHVNSRDYYNSLVGTLAKKVYERMDGDKKNTKKMSAPLDHTTEVKLPEREREKELVYLLHVKQSGMLINTMGYVTRTGYQLLIKSAQTLKVDIIIVLGNEKLYNDLVRDMPLFVRVCFLPSNINTYEKSKSYRSKSRMNRFKRYFYGTSEAPREPYAIDVKFTDIRLARVSLKSGKVSAIEPGSDILHYICSLSRSTVLEEVTKTSISGLLCIKNVDTENNSLTLLSPKPELPPNPILLITEMEFKNFK